MSEPNEIHQNDLLTFSTQHPKSGNSSRRD